MLEKSAIVEYTPGTWLCHWPRI